MMGEGWTSHFCKNQAVGKKRHASKSNLATYGKLGVPEKGYSETSTEVNKTNTQKLCSTSLSYDVVEETPDYFLTTLKLIFDK